jgi:hypothetical protein
MQRHEESASSPRWLRNARDQAGWFQSEGRAESERWMEEFERIERERQAAVRRGLSVQREKDRRLMLAAAIVFCLLLAATLLAAITIALRG